MNEQKATPEQQKAWAERHGITPPAGFYAKPAPFVIASGAMRVTDPCYDMDTWCAGTLENVKNGTWLGTSYNQYDTWAWSWMMNEMPLLGLKYDDTKPSEPKEVFAKVSALLTGLTEEERESKLPELQAVLVDFGFSDRVANLIITLWDDEVPEAQRESGVTMWLKGDVSFNDGTTRPEYTERLEAMKNGHVGSRCYWMNAVHEDYKDDPRFQPDVLMDTLLNAEFSEIHVGVDSGQAGVFDLQQFADIRAGGEATFEAFYDKACIASYPESRRNPHRDETTVQDPNAGPVQLDGAETAMGFNASSGYGDGSYRLRLVRDDAGQVIFINIMFISNDERLDKQEEERLFDGMDDEDADESDE